MPPRIAFGGLKIACKKYAIFYLSNELNNNMIGDGYNIDEQVLQEQRGNDLTKGICI